MKRTRSNKGADDDKNLTAWHQDTTNTMFGLSPEEESHEFVFDENSDDVYEEHIPLEKICFSKFQTRRIKLDNEYIETLANSIKANGLIDSIEVHFSPTYKYNPIIDGNDEQVQEMSYEYVMIRGHCRLLAHILMEEPTIRANVFVKITDQEAYLRHINENITRKNLTIKEKAAVLDKGRHYFNFKTQDLAKGLGCTPERVCQIKRLKNLPKEVQDKLQLHEKDSQRHVDAFRHLIGNTKISTIIIDPKDTDGIKQTKRDVTELLELVIQNNLSGDRTLQEAKRLRKVKRTKQKTALSNWLIMSNNYVKSKLPSKINTETAEYMINQANIIKDNMESIISHCNKFMIKKNDNLTS